MQISIRDANSKIPLGAKLGGLGISVGAGVQLAWDLIDLPLDTGGKITIQDQWFPLSYNYTDITKMRAYDGRVRVTVTEL